MSDVSNPASPQVLISQSTVALSFGTSLVPTTSLRTTRNGADITLTYTNHTAEPQPMGNIGIGGLELGRYVERYDFRQGAELVRRDMSLHGDGIDGRWWEGHSAPGSAFKYPNDLFSPIEVFRGEGAAHTMAISLQYPVLEYKQVVRVQFSRRYGDWRSDVSFWLLGDLPAGQSRSYTLSVRVVWSTDNWLRALLPYRNYLRQHYGGVTYDRDPRPVYAPVTGQQFLVSPTNPYGYSNNAPTFMAGGHGQTLF